MKIKRSAFALVAAGALLSGCGNSDPDVLTVRIELHALKQELAYLRQQTEDLEPRVESAEQMALQAIDDRDAPTRLDCLRAADEVLHTRLAAVTARCEAVTSYPAGERIRLKVGNPTSAGLVGLSLTLYAGENAARGRSTKRLYHSTDLPLPPGAFRSIEIDFPGLDADDVKELAVRAHVAALALAQDQQRTPIHARQ